jgi:uncharacterized NAD(P)/FAD-binding protein YdhS
MQNLNINNTTPQQTIVENQIYDLVIVGSGISCTYTLIHYISLIKEKLSYGSFLNQPIKVAVLDKFGEFWTGVPYGSRTGKQSLIITALKEFLPPTERDRFITWLSDNHDAVLESLKARPGVLNQQWLKSYQEMINAGNWNDLFIPRYVFGWYLKEQVEQLLSEAKNQGYLQCDLFSGEVLDVQKINLKKYQVEFATPEHQGILRAEKVVLAIGSPPNKASFLSNFEHSQNNQDICAIANMYEPSQNSNLEHIIDFLKQSNTPKDNKVLIIGSNASALETLYSLNNIPEAQEAIGKFIVVSPNAEFPHRIYDDPTPNNYIPHNLQALVKSEEFTAQDIFETVKKDVKAALKQGETVDGTYKVISQEVITALNLLSFAEQKMFVIKYGVEIGKYQRRAGQDYLNVVDQMLLNGKLEFIKGKFIGTTEGKAGFEYISHDCQQQEVFNEPINVVINCAGFQDVTKSSSTLIRNLVEQGICIPNDSKVGFEMSGDFEANENFYLMGPLVAGNINDKLKVWHAESCGRIFNLSQKLAEALV